MNTNEHTTVIEVNGVKLEVDLRAARRIDTMRVGSRVKVLTKNYGNDYTVRPGVVAGFDPFTSLPTITIAVLTLNYSEAKLEFIAYNGKTENVEVVAAVDNDELEVDRDDVLRRFDKEIEKCNEQITDLRRRRSWFLHNFRAYFVDLGAASVSAEASQAGARG